MSLGFQYARLGVNSGGGLDSVFLESKSFSLAGLKACLDLD